MKSKSTVYLGSLGALVYFSHKDTLYRTITYPPSNVNHTYGSRWCLNMTTLKAEWFFCRSKVFSVKND